VAVASATLRTVSRCATRLCVIASERERAGADTHNSESGNTNRAETKALPHAFRRSCRAPRPTVGRAHCPLPCGGPCAQVSGGRAGAGKPGWPATNPGGTPREKHTPEQQNRMPHPATGTPKAKRTFLWPRGHGAATYQSRFAVLWLVREISKDWLFCAGFSTI
jgi:hypothetical protein